jgi:5S rRNA maturation endonuclease (ribonuclease M5)
LQQYADAKRLPVDLLKQWHVSDAVYNGKPAVRIEYRDVDGNLLAVQFRVGLHKGANGEERFRWRRGDSARIYGLWRMPEYSKRNLWVVEGSSDAHSLWSAGIPCIALPSASAKELAPDLWRIAERFERIYLCLDADSAGRELLEALAQACPETLQERACVVQLPDGVKDVSALWLQVDANPEAFRNALAECPRIPIREFANSRNPIGDGDFANNFANSSEEDSPLLVPLSEWLDSYGDLQLEWLPLLGVEGIIARGATTLLAAHPKAGKTTLLVHACREWLQQGLRVVYLSEEPPLAWKLRTQRFPELRNLIVSAIPRAHPENWAKAILEAEPDVVIIDTLRRFANISDETDAAKVSAALSYFVNLTRENPRIAVLLAHHTRKGVRSLAEASVDDVAGSHAFSGEVDGIITLLKNPQSERQRLLKPIEGRLWLTAPEPMVLELSEDGSNYTILGITDEVLPEQEREAVGTAVLDALRVLGQATARELGEHLKERGIERTVRWLQGFLAECVSAGTVEREGEGTRNAPYVYRLADSRNNSRNQESIGDFAISRIRETAPHTPCAQQEAVEPDSRNNSRNGDSLYDFANSRFRESDAPVPPDVADADLLHIIEHRTAKGEAHLAPLLCELWALAKALDYPRLAYRQGHSVIPCASGYISALKHLDAGDLPLLFDALQQVSAAGASAPAPTHTPDADGGGSSLAVVPQGLVN